LGMSRYMVKNLHVFSLRVHLFHLFIGSSIYGSRDDKKPMGRDKVLVGLLLHCKEGSVEMYLKQVKISLCFTN
jgi:hypothetical protein